AYDCGKLQNPKFSTQRPVPGTRIPTLDEVFSMVENLKDPHALKVRFNIETKIYPHHPNYTVSPKKFIALFFDVVNRHKIFDRVVLQSFDYRTLIEARKVNPKTVISVLTENPVENLVDTATVLKANIISPYYKILTRNRVSALHALGVRVLPWTPNTPSE